jgi:hypothetical protein
LKALTETSQWIEIRDGHIVTTLTASTKRMDGFHGVQPAKIRFRRTWTQAVFSSHTKHATRQQRCSCTVSKAMEKQRIQMTW